MMEAINEKTFDAAISEGVVLVDCWAEWCGPCRMLMPVLEQISEGYVGKIKFVKVNGDENPSVMQRFGIRSIPTLLIFKNGELAETIIGALSAGEIEKRLAKFL